MRYVERNALNASLVARAEDWEWGSLRWRVRGHAPIELATPPMSLPKDWVDFVNTPQTLEELAGIRTAIERQAPYGENSWRVSKACELGLEQSLAPRGRPRKPIVTMK
jgi:putative transposase